MNRTLIPWVKNPDGTQGYTCNPFSGCLNHTPDGLCLGGLFPCFAYKLANGRLRTKYLANRNVAPFQFVDGNTLTRLDSLEVRQDPFYPRLWEDRFIRADKILKASKKPLGVFPCDMSDWCGIGIPYAWSNMLYSFIVMHKRHRFYLLTKQPQNLTQFSPFPGNCYVGVTATDRHSANRAQKYMLKVEAKVKYLSVEPYLDVIPWELLLGYDWLIIGALTGSRYDLLLWVNHYYDDSTETPFTLVPHGNKWALIPPFEWVEEIVNAADSARIPVFIKPPLSDIMNYHRSELPEVN